jgi:cobalt-zinc-cadmium efflux system outer membrane protein
MIGWLFVLLQAAAPQTAPLDLAALEAQALARHPAIRAAAAGADAARSRANQAGSWTNPVIGVVADELRPREQPSGVYGGFIQQAVPLGGKLSAAKGVAASQAAEAAAALDAARQRVLFDVRDRYYALVIAEERVRVATGLASVADRSVEMARQLINVGIADRPDVLSAEAEAARMKSRLVEARALRAAAWQRLGAAVADPDLAPRELAQDVSAALPELDRAQTLARVLAENGAIVAAERLLVTQRSQVAAEQSATAPDLFVRADVAANRERAHERAIGPQLGIEAGVSIPLFNRNRGGTAAASSMVSAGEAAVAAARLDVTAAFASVFAEYESSRAAVDAYRNQILPKAQESLQLQAAKYREMLAAYPPVLQAERTLFEMTEEYLAALDRAWSSLSALRTAQVIR